MIANNILNTYFENFYYRLDRRVYYLGHTVLNLVSGISDFCIGSGAAVLAIGTLGRVNSLNEFAYEELAFGGHVVTKVYRSFLKTINPSADFYRVNQRNFAFGSILTRESWVTMDDEGIFNEKVKSYLFAKIDQNISSRFLKIKLKGIAMIASTATIVLDFPIALIGATGSILTGGRFKLLNTIGACHGLDVLSQITQIYTGVICLLNNEALNSNLTL